MRANTRLLARLVRRRPFGRDRRAASRSQRTVMDQKSNLLIRVSRPAMACEFEVCFPADKCEDGTDFALAALDLVEEVEDRLSFFRSAGEISRINALAAETPVEVDEPLFDLLCLAMRLNEETDGAYDITSTPLWEAWGFARRAGEIPSDAQLAAARACVGGHWIELDSTNRTIRFRKAGVKINLGSIGKGYALDVCAEHLHARGMADFLLHGGQSSVLARGRPPATQAWEVGLSDPRRPGHRLAVVRLADRALGTSSSQFQSFRHHGRRYTHILDPRSGMPAEGTLSATVVAPTAALADALSTAFFVMGLEKSLAYCGSHPEIGMVMLRMVQRGEDVEIHRAGLTDMEISLGDG
jgi:FAD:protein FMN transferase